MIDLELLRKLAGITNIIPVYNGFHVGAGIGCWRVYVLGRRVSNI